MRKGIERSVVLLSILVMSLVPVMFTSQVVADGESLDKKSCDRADKSLGDSVYIVESSGEKSKTPKKGERYKLSIAYTDSQECTWALVEDGSGANPPVFDASGLVWFDSSGDVLWMISKDAKIDGHAGHSIFIVESKKNLLGWIDGSHGSCSQAGDVTPAEALDHNGQVHWTPEP